MPKHPYPSLAIRNLIPLPKINYKINSLEEAVDYVYGLLWNLDKLVDTGFKPHFGNPFSMNLSLDNYNLYLPHGDEMKGLVEKILEGEPANNETRNELKDIIEKEYFREYFQDGLLNIIKHSDLTESLLSKLVFLPDLDLPEKVEVSLTRYGPGGSINPIEGNTSEATLNPKYAKIMVLTTSYGAFKRPNPSQIIAHEFLELSAYSILRNNKLTPFQRERIVDLTIQEMCGEILDDPRQYINSHDRKSAQITHSAEEMKKEQGYRLQSYADPKVDGLYVSKNLSQTVKNVAALAN